MVLKILNTSREVINAIAYPQNFHIRKSLESNQSGICGETLYFSARTKEYIDALQVENYVETEDQRYVIKEIHGSGERIDVVATVDVDDFKTAEPGTWYWVTSDDLTPEDWFRPIADRVEAFALGAPVWKLFTDITESANFRGNDRYVNRTPWEFLCYGVQCFGAEAWIDAKHNYVYMYKRRGEDKGAYFTRDLNLKRLALDATSYDLVTRLYVEPKNTELNISTVNTNTPGANYVELRDAVDKQLCAMWVPDEQSDTEYTTPEEVFAAALSTIEELSRPVTAYSADVVDLAAASSLYRQILDYDIGDTVLLANHLEDKLQKHRIVELDIYPNDESKNTAVLSSKPIDLLRAITRMNGDTATRIAAVEEALRGSDWQFLELDSGFEQYSDAQVPMYKKTGNIVQLVGAVKPTAAIAGGVTEYVIGVVPEGCRPAQNIVTICQGSGRAVWMCYVRTTGTVAFSRYRDETGYTEASTSTWLPFNCSYFCG